MHKPQLIVVLNRLGIALNTWGDETKKTKTVDDLFRDIQAGNSELIEEGGQLFRKVDVAAVDIYYREGVISEKLREHSQVFLNGKIITRPDLEASLLEKILPGEGGVAAVFRALGKWFGISRHLDLVSQSTEKRDEPCKSFPGIMTRFSFSRFDIVFPKDLYKPEGYKKVQKDKTVFFKWVRVPGEEVEAARKPKIRDWKLLKD